MFYLYCIVLILTGCGLGYYGLKKFNIAMALSFVIPALMALGMIGLLGSTSILITLFLGAMIFIFAKPFSYITAYFYSAFILAMFVILIFGQFIEELPEIIKIVLRFVILVPPIVFIFMFRRHVKAIIIGISSGFSIGLGLAGIITPQIFLAGISFQSLDTMMTALFVPFIMMLAAMIGGVLFQYLYIAKQNPELIKVTKIAK